MGGETSKQLVLCTIHAAVSYMLHELPALAVPQTDVDHSKWL